MKGQRGFWDFEDRLQELCCQGDSLEKLSATVDFEVFRPVLEEAIGPRAATKGGRPPFDAALKFRMLVLQALHGLSLEQTEYLVRDRLSWMRFCGLGPGDAVPDANKLWDFREALIAAKALDAVFARLDQAITETSYLPMSGQIVDATLVNAPRQHNTDGEKEQIKAGRTARDIWPGEAREGAPEGHGCTLDGEVLQGAVPDGTQRPDIAIPTFGYKAHISIDRRHSIIRRNLVTDAAAHAGARLRQAFIDPNNTASDVWADTAYRSRANEAYLRGIGKVSRVHMKKPKSEPMSKRTAQSNARKSAVRSRVDHPFALLKGRCGLW